MLVKKKCWFSHSRINIFYLVGGVMPSLQQVVPFSRVRQRKRTRAQCRSQRFNVRVWPSQRFCSSDRSTSTLISLVCFLLFVGVSRWFPHGANGPCDWSAACPSPPRLSKLSSNQTLASQRRHVLLGPAFAGKRDPAVWSKHGRCRLLSGESSRNCAACKPLFML